MAVLHGATAGADVPIHTDADVAAQVSFNPIPGTAVPLGLQFISTRGTVEIGEILQQDISLLTFAWFECPNLCGLALNALADGSSRLQARTDTKFQVIVVSLDSAENQADATRKQQNLAERYPQADVLNQWQFLTGSAEAIAALADAVGFQFIYDQRKAQFAHPSGVIALDTQGHVRNFISGINYQTSDLERLLDLRPPSNPTVASANPLLLLCYDYDPSSGRYSLAIMKLLRLVSFLCLLIFAGVLWRWRQGGSDRFHE